MAKLRWTLAVLLLVVMILGALGVASAQEEPKRGGTLVVATNRIPTNLYPGRSTGLPDIALNMLIYDALVITDDKGQVHPALARSWEVSEDGLVWTFYLRDDVYFHSGRKFTAHDVKFHFDRWQTEFPTRAKINALDRTEVVDDYTVRFYLKYPTLVFLNNISQSEWGYGGIPDSEAVKQWGDDYGIVPESISGTGPFRVVSWTRDQQVVLERNEQYNWGPAFYNNQGAPYVDRVIYRSIPEDAARSTALELGEIDIDIAVSPRDASRFENMRGVRLLTQSRVSANHIGFNHWKPVFQDLRVRRAFTHAINQQDIVDFVWNGYAEPVCGFWHPSVDGSTPCEEIRPLLAEYDPDKANQLLDEAGWVRGPSGIRMKDGQPLQVYMYVYSEVQEQIALVVQAHLRDVGVDVRIRNMEYAAWTDALARAEHDIYYVDGTHSTADFAYWFTEAALPYPNGTKWVDPETERLYQISQQTVNPAERTAAFQAIERRFIEQAVMIPMPHHNWIVGMRDYVKGVTFHPIHGLYKMLDIWLDR